MEIEIKTLINQNTKITKASKLTIKEHLKYQNYKLGNDRYLTKNEMESLQVGDLILLNRKGFVLILNFCKNESGIDIMNLEFIESLTSIK